MMQFEQQPEQSSCSVIGGKIIENTLVIKSFKDEKEEEECRRIFSFLPKCYLPMFTRFAAAIPLLRFHDIMPLGRELYDLSLPRRIQSASSLSKHNTIMLIFTWCSAANCGLMPFAFDADQSKLYHVGTKEINRSYGYVAVHDTLYFIGGMFEIHEPCYAIKEAIDSIQPILLRNHLDLQRPLVDHISKDILNSKLEVPTVNFRTGKWEDITKVTKLNAPKRNPFVFTFERKIYALAAKNHVDLSDRFSSFEFLDTTISSESPTTWTYLPAPPFIAARDTCYILWKEKKWLLVKISDNPDDCLDELLWKFDLVSRKWCNNTTDSSSSYYDPQASEFLSSLIDVPAYQFEGCIVRDVWFCFQDNKIKHGRRLVLGHDLRGKEAILRRWKIDLKDVLRDDGLDAFLPPSCLHHLGDFTFCLAINYRRYSGVYFNFLCTLKFSLEGWGDAIGSESEVNPKFIYRKYFQLPNSIYLTSHTKLETWD